MLASEMKNRETMVLKRITDSRGRTIPLQSLGPANARAQQRSSVPRRALITLILEILEEST